MVRQLPYRIYIVYKSSLSVHDAVCGLLKLSCIFECFDSFALLICLICSRAVMASNISGDGGYSVVLLTLSGVSSSLSNRLIHKLRTLY